EVSEIAGEQRAHPFNASRRNFNLELRALHPLHRNTGDAAVAQQIGEIRLDPLDVVLDRFINLYFQNQMATALQIQSPVNPLRRQEITPPGRQVMKKSWSQIKQGSHSRNNKQRQS